MISEVQSNTSCGSGPAHDPAGLEVLCSWCLRVRGYDGVWIGAKSNPARDRFGHYSHGICPVCLERHFKELALIVSATAADSAAERTAFGLEAVAPTSALERGTASPEKVRTAGDATIREAQPAAPNLVG